MKTTFILFPFPKKEKKRKGEQSNVSDNSSRTLGEESAGL